MSEPFQEWSLVLTHTYLCNGNPYVRRFEFHDAFSVTEENVSSAMKVMEEDARAHCLGEPPSNGFQLDAEKI
jgi:hypothetical protein